MATTRLAYTLFFLLATALAANAQGLPLGNAIPSTRLDWHPDGNMLAVSNNQNVTIISAVNQQIQNSLPLLSQLVVDIKWSPDGTRLAVAYGSEIQIWRQPWDMNVAKLVLTISNPLNLERSDLISVNWYPTGERILGVQPPYINIWDTTSGVLLETMNADPMPLLCAEWSPDGSKLAMGDLTGSIFVKELASGNFESAEVFDRYAIRSIAWSDDSIHLAIGTASGWIQIVSLGEFLATDGMLNAASENTISLDWHPTRNWLASGDTEGKLIVWDVARMQIIEEIDTSSALPSVRWSPDGNQLAYSGNTNVNIVNMPPNPPIPARRK